MLPEKNFSELVIPYEKSLRSTLRLGGVSISSTKETASNIIALFTMLLCEQLCLVETASLLLVGVRSVYGDPTC